MLDIKFIRENPDIVKKAAKDKNIQVDLDLLLELDETVRSLKGTIDELNRQKNELAKRGSSGKPNTEDIEAGKKIKTELSDREAELTAIAARLKELSWSVPNIPAADVPVGKTEGENVVVKQWGDVRKFGFTPKNHWQIGQELDWIDKERATKVAGARFAYIKGNLVKLQWALMQFGLDVLTNATTLESIAKSAGLDINTKPFIPVLPPLMIRTDVYEATGRLNKEEVTYKIEQDDLWLEASAEHSLAPMYKDEILSENQLPVRYVGYATSFRREAGTYGKDMEGILRMHQFDKFELESFTTAEQSMNEHLFLIAIQEYLMQQLNLPYQVLLKCTADIGKPNARGVDIEVWLPGQNKYRETHTADLMTDYQARRLQTRVRRNDGAVEFVHTNDATAFSQRPLIAIIENYQNEDGTVAVPAVLRPYMGGLEVLS